MLVNHAAPNQDQDRVMMMAGCHADLGPLVVVTEDKDEIVVEVGSLQPNQPGV
jgi:hypothetical protein